MPDLRGPTLFGASEPCLEQKRPGPRLLGGPGPAGARTQVERARERPSSPEFPVASRGESLAKRSLFPAFRGALVPASHRSDTRLEMPDWHLKIGGRVGPGALRVALSHAPRVLTRKSKGPDQSCCSRLSLSLVSPSSRPRYEGRLGVP